MNFNPQDTQAGTPGQTPELPPQPQASSSPWQQAQPQPQPGASQQSGAQPYGQPIQPQAQQPWAQQAGPSGYSAAPQAAVQPNAVPVYDATPGLTGAPVPKVDPFAPVPAGKPSKKWFILALVFIFTTVAAIGGGAWAFVNYFDQKENVDSKVSVEVAAAVKEQADKDAAAFLEKEKQPYRLFAGPDDYGSLAFEYPKTWSLHVANDASKGGTYAAYLNPVSVPPIGMTERYGLRVTVEERDYDQVLNTYKNLVTKGDLQSSTFKLDDETSGTRLDGSFTKDIRGSAVIFKIRDKTVTLRTDAETFKGDFDTLIKTIQFNK